MPHANKHEKILKPWIVSTTLILTFVGSWLTYYFPTIQPSQASTLKHTHISIFVNGFPYKGTTTRPTVRQALAELGIPYREDSIISPHRDASITEDLYIDIQNKLNYFISVDSQEMSGRTFPTTVGDVLLDNNISLGEDDSISHRLDDEIVEGTHIVIERISTKILSTQETIPFRTIYQDDDSLKLGHNEIKQQGVAGSKEVLLQRTYKDGEIENETIISEQTTSPPVDHIIRRGTKIVTGKSLSGQASWYKSVNRLPDRYVSACLSFPQGTQLKVTSTYSHKYITVVVNDLGPYNGRLIDLDSQAFTALGLSLGQGVADVVIEEIL